MVFNHYAKALQVQKCQQLRENRCEKVENWQINGMKLTNLPGMF